jgi:hypothetical protein
MTRLRQLLAALFAMLFVAGALVVVAAPRVLSSQNAVEAVPAQNPQAPGQGAPVSEQEQTLTEEEFREFLRTAKVVNFKHTSMGVTAPFKLTLSNGQRTLEGLFQSIDQSKALVQLPGRTEVGFRDSFHFNIAAYQLAKLLSLEDMIPATVEYKWGGNGGSLCWWVRVKMHEQERIKQKVQPPDVNAWNKQMNKMWVFSELIYDTDRNQTNILITENWKLWMIDFTRAFRSQKDLNNPKNLVQCDRGLLQKLRQLDDAEVLKKTKPHLSKSQVQAVMARRDKIVAHFEELIAQKGEDRVLY